MERRSFLKSFAAAALMGVALNIQRVTAVTVVDPEPAVPEDWPYWQDVEGTIPALEEGDPVGLWKGGIMFNGEPANLYQEATSCRPTLRKAEDDFSCEFDDVDDFLGFDRLQAPFPKRLAG